MSFKIFSKTWLSTICLIAIGTFLILALIQAGFTNYIPLILINVLILMLVLLKKYLTDSRFILFNVYLLLAATFLNNAFFSINLGFFSLFPYRILLISVGFLILLNLTRYEYRNDLNLEWNKVKVKGSLLFFVTWLNYAFLSLLWAKSVTHGIKYISILVMGTFLLFVVILYIQDIKRILNFYYIWIFMAFLLMLIGYWNYFLNQQLPSSTLYEGPEYKMHYPTSVFFNQNDHATFLAISMFFFLSLIRNGESLIWKSFGLLTSIMAFHQILISDSRASQLAVIIGLGVYIFLLSTPKIKKGIAVLTSISITLVIIVLHNQIWRKFSELFLNPTVRDFSERLPSNEGRANLIRNAFHFSLESYGLGIGAGNAEHYMEHYLIHDTDGVVNVHFWFLELLTNFGIFITLGYVTLYFYLIYKLYIYHQLKLSQQYNLFLESVLVGMAAFLFASISPSSVANLFYHWVFIAFALASLNILRKSKRKLKYSHNSTEEAERYGTDI